MIYETRNGALCVNTGVGDSMVAVQSAKDPKIRLGMRMQMLPAVPQRFEVIRESNLREWKPVGKSEE